jgi:serine/threonine protein kinase
MTLSAGTRLGPYEIQSAIGAGGTGQVYKARDTQLDCQCASRPCPEESHSTLARLRSREADTIHARKDVIHERCFLRVALRREALNAVISVQRWR